MVYEISISQYGSSHYDLKRVETTLKQLYIKVTVIPFLVCPRTDGSAVI